MHIRDGGDCNLHQRSLTPATFPNCHYDDDDVEGETTFQLGEKGKKSDIVFSPVSPERVRRWF